MKILKYSEFIKESTDSEFIAANPVAIPRTRNITLDEAIEFYLSNCNNWDLDKAMLYRGVDKVNPYSIIDPRLSTRKYMTINSELQNKILSLLPSWKNMPNRLKSIFCATSIDATGNYRNINDYLIVIPTNGSKLALTTDTNDFIFNNSHYRKTYFQETNTHTFFANLASVLDMLSIRDAHKLTKEQLLHEIDHIKEKLTNGSEERINIIKKEYNQMYKFIMSSNSFIESLDDLFDPKLNNIITTTSQDDLIKYNKSEVFTEDKCLLISNLSFKEFKQAIEDKIN